MPLVKPFSEWTGRTYQREAGAVRYTGGIRTAGLMAALGALMLAVGFAAGRGPGLLLALLIALAVHGVSYFWSDRIALRSMRAHPVGEVQAPVMYRLVRELSSAARQPMPRLYISETMQPNAFATGRNPRNAAVCCTRGLLHTLDERELRAVLAHELSHVHNRDILLSSVAAAIATVITYLSYLAIFLPGRSEDEEGPGLVGALLMAVLGPIAAAVVQMAISRTREHRADAAAARLCGDPLALASALRKIEAGIRARPLPQDPELATTSSLMIANPFSGIGIGRLFSTHPPTAERVARLERLAGKRPPGS